MQTILFALILIISFINWFISLVVYFIHDDIKRGKSLSQVNIGTMNDTLIPLEIGTHGIITIFITFVDPHLYLAMFNMPLFVGNFWLFIRDDFNYKGL